MSTQLNGSAMNTETPGEVRQQSRGRWVAGLALIAIGLITLVANYVEIPNLGVLFLPALGLIFLLWGVAVRQVGLLIPGGILSGLGVGVYLMEGPFAHLADLPQTGVFLLSFATGWFLITGLSALVGDRIHWWPAIPGSILAVVGGALLTGGAALDALELIGKAWPLALIAAGIYLIFRRRI